MTQQEILDYNKRCAEFLGVKKSQYNEYEMYGFISCIEDGENEQHFFKPEDMKFHSDWNWIMELVEAIEKKVWINIKGCAVDISTIVNLNAPAKKQAVVQASDKFLIWYAAQKDKLK